MLNVKSFCTNNTNLYQALTILLDQCRSMAELKQLHSLIITSGLSQDDTFIPKILSFTALSDHANVDYSYQVLLQISEPATFYWNTIIRGYAKSKNPNRSLSVYIQMLSLGHLADHLTYPFLAKAVSRLEELRHGFSVHTHVVRTGFESDRFIVNSLIHMYASCRDIESARKVFDEIPNRNLVSWNVMLDGYAKCGDVSSMREVFDSMVERDVVSWSSLIDGYVKSGGYGEAMAMFERMRHIGPKANEVTMVSVLCACAHLGALEQGRIMHQYMIENSLKLTLVLQTSLVDMYAKCGAIDEALAVFREVPMKKTDVLIWNSVIGGLATHGFVEESLEYFANMQRIGIAPDEITYLCLLSACAHGGLVKEAWYFFECLDKNGMNPKSEHYACMINVLARAGQVVEAYEFLCGMPIEPTGAMLGALLSGCMEQKRSDIAEIVGKRLIEIEPDHDGRYIGLSNIYAVDERWIDAKTAREAMEKRGIKKTPGFSFVEISGLIHRFIAHDKTHPSSEQIYSILDFIVNQAKPDTYNESEDIYLYDTAFIQAERSL